MTRNIFNCQLYKKDVENCYNLITRFETEMSQVSQVKPTLKRRWSELEEQHSLEMPEKIVVRCEPGQSKCEVFPASNTCAKPQAETSVQRTAQNVNTGNEEKQQVATPETIKQRRILTASRVFEIRKFKFFQKFTQEEELLGEGAYGKVYAGTRKEDGLPVAIKYIPRNKAKLIKDDSFRLVPKEVYFQRQVNHPNAIKLLEHHFFDHHFVLVSERPSKCIDLFDFLNVYGEVLTEDEARPLFRELMEVVVHLNKQGILHNDLKSENILLDITDSGKVKLIDFGLASYVSEEPIKSFSGTPQFCPPEYHTNGQYDGRKATIWSLGCFLYDLLMGATPFKNAEEAATKHVTLKPHHSDDLFEFLSMMLTRDPAKRVCVQQLLQHQWLQPAYEPQQCTLMTYRLLESCNRD